MIIRRQFALRRELSTFAARQRGGISSTFILQAQEAAQETLAVRLKADPLRHGVVGASPSELVLYCATNQHVDCEYADSVNGWRRSWRESSAATHESQQGGLRLSKARISSAVQRERLHFWRARCGLAASQVEGGSLSEKQR